MRRPVREVIVARFGVRRTVARTPSSLRSKTQAGSLNGCAVSDAFIGSPLTAIAGSVPRRRAGYARVMSDLPGENPETEAAEREVDNEPAFKEGEEVWVQDDNG